MTAFVILRKLRLESFELFLLYSYFTLEMILLDEYDGSFYLISSLIFAILYEPNNFFGDFYGLLSIFCFSMLTIFFFLTFLLTLKAIPNSTIHFFKLSITSSVTRVHILRLAFSLYPLCTPTRLQI